MSEEKPEPVAGTRWMNDHTADECDIVSVDGGMVLYDTESGRHVVSVATFLENWSWYG